MLSVQKKVGFAMGISALLVAVVNAVQLTLERHPPLLSLLSSPYVCLLLAASAVPFLTALRDGVAGKAVQVLTLLGLGLAATVINPAGNLTGIVLVAFALVLAAQYELLGVRYGPRLVIAVVLYGAFAAVTLELRLQRPVISALNNLIAAGGFLYLFWVVFTEEVQNRRRSERRLQDSERRFQQAIKNANMMATNQDRALRYTWGYNPHEFLPADSFVGYTDEDIYSPEEAAHLRSVKEQVMESGAGTQEEFRARFGGVTRSFDLSIQPIRGEKGEVVGIETTSRDITERVVLRDHLVQSERFAAAGQLATYIAHEINSPLQGIASMLDYMRKSYSSHADLTERLDLINEAFASIKGTVKRLLDLNRPGSEREETLDLNEVIRGTFALTAGLLRERGISPVLHLSEDSLEVLGVAQDLTQVFLNLINNSVEAILRGEEERPAGAGRRITVSSRREGKRALIDFCDSGPGFTEEGLEHAFDPFHSGKSKIGMGVGLAICLQIIQGVGGTIDVANAPSGGACFRIAIPAG